MDIHASVELFDCPYCGGPALLEEEHGWCWYVMCMDCGAQTASIPYDTPEERLIAAQKAGELWNSHKIIRSENGE